MNSLQMRPLLRLTLLYDRKAFTEQSKYQWNTQWDMWTQIKCFVYILSSDNDTITPFSQITNGFKQNIKTGSTL